jgi:uncharacterized protein (TIGR02996 family)
VDPLLSRVLQQPDDDELRQVWADTLIERGDPRGELIVLQHAATERTLSRREAQRVRALVAQHHRAWLGELANVIQHREGLVFDRGVLDECQVQIKRLDDLHAAVGHPLWATLRRIWFADHFAWDRRIVPLLAHPVFARLRDVLCVGMHNVFGPLATQERSLPFAAIWTMDDGWRGRYGPLGEGHASDAPALPALRRLGFTLHREGGWILELPVVRRLEKLGLTVLEPAAFWLERARPLSDLTTVELRPFWIPLQGAGRPHWVLRFTRGADGRFSRLALQNAGRCGLHMLSRDLDTVEPDAVERIEATSDDPEVLAYLKSRFGRHATLDVG